MKQFTLLQHVKAIAPLLKKETKYNVLTTLLQPHDEVRLHSRMLASLLDPCQGANHNCQEHLLASFLPWILEASTQPSTGRHAHHDSHATHIINFPLQGAHIERESENIDLLIINPSASAAIIIENKILAGDQPRQIERYHEIVSARGIKDITIIYLSLDGHPPSKQSCGKVSNVVCMSYSAHILPWLRESLAIVAENPPLRESILQYIDVLESITSTQPISRMSQELHKLFNSDPEALSAAGKIAAAYKDYAAELERAFWLDLTKTLENIGEHTQAVLPHRDLQDKLNRRHAGGKNCQWYGIDWVLKDNNGVISIGIGNWDGVYVGFHRSALDCANQPHEQRLTSIFLRNEWGEIPGNWYAFKRLNLHPSHNNIDDLIRFQKESLTLTMATLEDMAKTMFNTRI